MQIGFNKRAPTPQDPAITRVRLPLALALVVDPLAPAHARPLLQQMRNINEMMTKTAVAGRYLGAPPSSRLRSSLSPPPLTRSSARSRLAPGPQLRPDHPRTVQARGEHHLRRDAVALPLARPRRQEECRGGPGRALLRQVHPRVAAVVQVERQRGLLPCVRPFFRCPTLPCKSAGG